MQYCDSMEPLKCLNVALIVLIILLIFLISVMSPLVSADPLEDSDSIDLEFTPCKP